jgi:hypothetical protein
VCPASGSILIVLLKAFFADTALSTHLLCIFAPFVLINNTDIPDRIIYSVMSVCIMKIFIKITLYFVTF